MCSRHKYNEFILNLWPYPPHPSIKLNPFRLGDSWPCTLDFVVFRRQFGIHTVSPVPNVPLFSITNLTSLSACKSL